MSWDLEPGEQIVRKNLQAKYGGRPQGGIGPSSTSPNVLLFTDPATGRQHGYFDGWDGESYHYYGEGQVGDQRMVSGNRAIRDHFDEGRALRLFAGSRGTVTYLGEFVLDSEEPYYETDGRDREGAVRKVIVFKLSPVGDAKLPGATPVTPGNDTTVDVVPVEEQYTEQAFVDPSREPYEIERREARLVLALRDHLQFLGHEVGRLKIVPKGEAKPLFADLYDATADALVEAKGTVSREAIRMAIGQLVDYSRFRQAASRVILVPERPRRDLLELAHVAGLLVVWPDGGAYAAHPSSPW